MDELNAGSMASDSEPARLLSALGYLTTRTDAEPNTEHRVRLLNIADRFDRFFSLRSSAAPGLALVGAQISPAHETADANGTAMVGFSGAGLTFRQAFECCAGEACEYLSQLVSGAGEIAGLTHTPTAIEADRQTQEQLAARLGVATEELFAAPMLTAARLSNGAPVSVPAALCLRFPRTLKATRPLVALSEGVAASTTVERASLRALLELVERDAAALWWIGGRRGRSFSLEQLHRAGVTELVRSVRGGSERRTTEFLDITSDLCIPCVAVWSTELDGKKFACGLAARPHVEDAMRSAFIELCAMEMNFELQPSPPRDAAYRKTRTIADLSRDVSIGGLESKTLKGEGYSCLPLGEWGGDETQMISAVSSQLDKQGLDAFMVDLTRSEFAIPVVKAFVPGLQPMTPALRTSRLLEVLDEWGGGDLQSNDWNLMSA